MDPAAHRQALLNWYDAEARDLPWRAPPGAVQHADPYRVWLSEVMLQQTTVPHATPYFLSFTERWPTVQALAAAADEDVMAAWAGLGYYARARNLLACARAVSSDHGGAFPDTEAELLSLPGVGAYTAAAVAAIAFDRPANVVDGNVERVMARLFAVETPLPGARPELKRLAASLVGEARPGDWAQALMDLGATVCRPRSPVCEACPVAVFCVARMQGQAERYPLRAPKAARPERLGHVYVLSDVAGRIALERRPSRGLLGGMLGLPTSAWSEAEPQTEPPTAGDWREAGVVVHVFTHFRLTLKVWRATTDQADNRLWMTPGEAASALPSVFRKALNVA